MSQERRQLVYLTQQRCRHYFLSWFSYVMDWIINNVSRDQDERHLKKLSWLTCCPIDEAGCSPKAVGWSWSSRRMGRKVRLTRNRRKVLQKSSLREPWPWSEVGTLRFLMPLPPRPPAKEGAWAQQASCGWSMAGDCSRANSFLASVVFRWRLAKHTGKNQHLTYLNVIALEQRKQREARA